MKTKKECKKIKKMQIKKLKPKKKKFLSEIKQRGHVII